MKRIRKSEQPTARTTHLVLVSLHNAVLEVKPELNGTLQLQASPLNQSV